MRKAFAGLATLFMLAVVVQFFLAASGAFATASDDESYQPHRALAIGILLFAVVMTVVAALARMPRRLVGMAGLVAGLTVVQFVISGLAKAIGDDTTAGQLVFGLHAVNGLAIVVVAGRIVREARVLSRGAAALQRRAGHDGASRSAAGSAQPAA